MFQVAAQTGARSVGIEIRDDLNELAQSLAVHYEDSMKELNRPHGKVTLIHVGHLLPLNDAHFREMRSLANGTMYSPTVQLFS